jgi:hypothetical protein
MLPGASASAECGMRSSTLDADRILAVKPVIQAVIIVLAAVAALAPVSPDTVERWFSTGLYPPIQRALTPVANRLPFAWLDLLVIGAIIALIVFIVRTVKASRRAHRIAPALHALATLATAAAVVYLLFLIVWGFNYRRIAMTERLSVQPGPPTSDAVLALGVEAATQMNALHDQAHATGWTAPVDDARLRAAFASVQRMLSDGPTATPGRLKGTMFGPYFRWTSVDGMINPFGLEVLHNPDLLEFEQPFIAAHEWAHLAGYADESEASFVGWLTCMQGDVPSRYSGWLFLYWQVSGEVDAGSRAKLGALIQAGPRADINAVVERLQRGQLPWLRATSWRVYDQYLKANRVEAGIRSYGAVVTLILRAQFGPGWTPVRRASVAPAPGS